jgi:hypothetical protein
MTKAVPQRQCGELKNSQENLQEKHFAAHLKIQGPEFTKPVNIESSP